MTLYVLKFQSTISRAHIDQYELVRETDACWIVRLYGGERRLLKSAHRGYTDIEALKAFVKEQTEKEIAEATALLDKLRTSKGIPVNKMQAEPCEPLTAEQLAKAFDD